jgi:hypothetical protein
MMEDDGTGATQAQSNVAKANNMIVVNLRSMVVALDFVLRMAPKAQVDQALAIRSIQRKSHPEGWLFCPFKRTLSKSTGNKKPSTVARFFVCPLKGQAAS